MFNGRSHKSHSWLSLKIEVCTVPTKVLSTPALFIRFLVELIIMLCLKTSNQAQHCCSRLSDNPVEEGYCQESPRLNMQLN